MPIGSRKSSSTLAQPTMPTAGRRADLTASARIVTDLRVPPSGLDVREPRLATRRPRCVPALRFRHACTNQQRVSRVEVAELLARELVGGNVELVRDPREEVAEDLELEVG